MTATPSQDPLRAAHSASRHSPATPAAPNPADGPVVAYRRHPCEVTSDRLGDHARKFRDADIDRLAE